MHREGHIGAALLAFAPIGFVAGALGGEDAALLAGAVAVGLAMVPDLDMRVPLVKHRGPTHTAWFAGVLGAAGLVVGFVFGLQVGVLAAVGMGLLLGVTAAVTIVSHLAADALTPMGVRPFKPWSKQKYTWDLFTAANPIANYVLLGLGSAVGVGLSVLGLMLHNAF